MPNQQFISYIMARTR